MHLHLPNVQISETCHKESNTEDFQDSYPAPKSKGSSGRVGFCLNRMPILAILALFGSHALSKTFHKVVFGWLEIIITALWD